MSRPGRRSDDHVDTAVASDIPPREDERDGPGRVASSRMRRSAVIGVSLKRQGSYSRAPVSGNGEDVNRAPGPAGCVLSVSPVRSPA